MARMIVRVSCGNPGGVSEAMGMAKREAKRRRSLPIHWALSVRGRRLVSWWWREGKGGGYGRRGNSLLIVRGGALLHIFISPPRNMGIYVISHFEKVGSFYTIIDNQSASRPISSHLSHLIHPLILSHNNTPIPWHRDLAFAFYFISCRYKPKLSIPGNRG